MEKPWNDSKRVREVRDRLKGRSEAELPSQQSTGQDGDALRYTVIIHKARIELGLTMLEYTIVDLVHQLSGRPDYPYCIKSKENIAKDLGYSRAGVFKALKRCLSLGLLEKGPRGGLRSTDLWYDAVVVERERMQRKRRK